MSYKNIALTGMFVGVATYASISYGLHHQEVLRSEILRSKALTVCNDGHCIDIKTHDLPKEIGVNAPLGIRYALDKKEVNCLARQLFQEPKQGNYLDRLGVGWGTINRVKHSQYPDTICGVVSQSRGKRYDMSWYGDLSKRNEQPRKIDIELAKNILLGNTENPIGNSRHWCNHELDNPNAFGCKEARKTENVGFKLRNTPHEFVEVTREGL